MAEVPIPKEAFFSKIWPAIGEPILKTISFLSNFRVNLCLKIWPMFALYVLSMNVFYL